jgi:hypothetical protein
VTHASAFRPLRHQTSQGRGRPGVRAHHLVEIGDRALKIAVLGRGETATAAGVRDIRASRIARPNTTMALPRSSGGEGDAAVATALELPGRSRSPGRGSPWSILSARRRLRGLAARAPGPGASRRVDAVFASSSGRAIDHRQLRRGVPSRGPVVFRRPGLSSSLGAIEESWPCPRTRTAICAKR